MKFTKNAKTSKATTLTSKNVGMVWPKISMVANLRASTPPRKALGSIALLEGDK